jgi:uncharacterized protein YeaO (DUF488 family)
MPAEWRKRLEQGLWQMQNGMEIPISEMTEKHIKNCIEMLETNIGRYCMTEEEYQAESAYITRFKLELRNRIRHKEKRDMIYITDMKDDSLLEYEERWAIVRSLKNPMYGLKQVTALAPSRELYQWFLEERDAFRWTQDAFDEIYVPRFLKEFGAEAQKALDELEALEKAGKRIVLTCFCPSEERCHRSIVAGIMQYSGRFDVRTAEGKDYSFYGKMLEDMQKQQDPPARRRVIIRHEKD